MIRSIVLGIIFWGSIIIGGQAQSFPICDTPTGVQVQPLLEKAMQAYSKKEWRQARSKFLQALALTKDEPEASPCLEQIRWIKRSVLRTYFSEGNFSAFYKAHHKLLLANSKPVDREQAIFKGRLLLLGSKAAIVERNWVMADTLAAEAEALQEAQEAWLQAVRSGVTRATIAYYQGDYQQMELYLDRAFATQQEQLREDLTSLQKIMNLYGVVYYETGDYEKAAQRTLQAIETNLQQPEEQQNKGILAQSYNNLGLYYMELGDIYKAKDYCNNALQLYQHSNNYLDAATTYLNLGEFFDRQGEHKEALSYYKKGTNSLDKSSSTRQDRVNRARVILNNGLAFSAIQLGHYPQALEALRQNLALHQEDTPKKEETLTILADYYARQKAYSKAHKAHQEALEARQVLYGNVHPKVAQGHLNIAKLYVLQLNSTKGAAELEAAAQALGAGDELSLSQWATGSRYRQINSHAGLWLKILQQQAQLLLVKEELVGAYQTAQNALQLLETERQQLQEKDSKLFLLQTMLPTYDIVVQTALRLHEKTGQNKYLETAFAASERSKALLLLDALRVEKARNFGQVPDSLLDKERRWNRAVVFHKKQLLEATRASDENGTALHQERLLKSKRALEKLQAQFEADYPDYYTLKYDDQTASIEAVQAALTENTILVEYFVGKDALYVFSITADSAWSTTLDKGDNFEALVKAFRTILTNLMQWKGQEEQQSAILARYARSFYQRYLEKALPTQAKERLIIVPDGLLNYIPFEVLLTERPSYEKIDLSTLPYLLRQYSISYHYSASLHLLTQQATPLGGAVLGLASSYDPSLINDAHLSSRQQKVRLLAKNLPGAATEVQRLEEDFAGDFFYKENANEARFKEQIETQHYSVVHLAMHGLVDAQQPEYSGLLFTYSDDEEQDDLLHAYELNVLSLQTDLVVLSACETGFGKYEHSEGVVSIGRGFMYAGAPSLLLTLWPLNDATSVYVMDAYYKGLNEGLPKDIALQQTKLRYLEQSEGLGGHPFFWAAFVQLGNTDSITIEGHYTRYKWMGLFFLFMIISAVLVYRQYKKRSLNNR